MGFHLVGRHVQPGRARPRAGRPAAVLAWFVAAAAFVGWMFAPLVDALLLRAELGYAAATAALCLLLWLLYRRGTPAAPR